MKIYITWRINILWKKYGFSEKDFIVGSFQEHRGAVDKPKVDEADIFIELVKDLDKTKNLKVLLAGTRRQYVINNLEKHGIDYKYFEMVEMGMLNELYNILDLPLYLQT